MTEMSLLDFLRESNRIEGIDHLRPGIIQAAENFLALPALYVGDVTGFVQACQPNAVLRDQDHLNVRVGDHIAPRGGPELVEALTNLLARVSARNIDMWRAHVEYETIHPYTDGNGRSGRMIWLWQRHGSAPLGFLHQFYYQTLSNVRQL